MPELSLIASEAEHLIGRLPEEKRRAAAQAVSHACEAHWAALRGPEPETPLAHALWAATPPLADLFVDLHAEASPELARALQGHGAAWGLALLALDEIERGDAEGARLAFEPMMVFQSETAAGPYAEHIAAALRGALPPLPLHRHTSQAPLWKALALIGAHTGRHDLLATLSVIGLLAAPPSPAGPDEALERLRGALQEQGIRFLGIDDHHISYEQHGHAHKPANTRQLEEMLLEIRQAWLAH